jgi:hypothetical protein
MQKIPRVYRGMLGRILVLAVLMMTMLMSMGERSRLWAADGDKQLFEQRDALLLNVEDMVAHGGMGDAKAILHHCGEAARSADFLIKQLPASQPGREEGIASLNDVVRHCKRVSDIGVHADPGVLLGPALKARTAARTAVKALGFMK